MFVSIKYRLLLSHVAVALIAAVAASVYLFISFTRLQVHYNEHALLSSAYALADAIETDFGTSHGQVLVEHAMRELATEEKAQFAVIDARGIVSASTDPSIRAGSKLPLMRGLLSGGPQVYHPEVYSPDQQRIIVDVPIERDHVPIGIVRSWILERDYQASLDPIKRITGLALVGIVVLCITLSMLLAYALTTRIKNMKQLSRRIARGDFGIRIDRTSRDELGELAADLNTMASRLQELENARREFLGNVSHDLRSPVSNIRITSEVLSRRAERLGDDSAKLFGTVISETERLELMIDELTELATIASGALVLDRETFDLETLIDEVMTTVSPRADQKAQEVRVEVETNLTIVGDRSRLVRAIVNLADNAIKFTPDSGRIEIKARRDSGCAVIEVSDSGEGIPRGDLAHIFERFYRVDKSGRRNDGSGIGLAIVKNVIEAHDGTVEVTSHEGHGSTFRVRLPLPRL